MAANLTAVPSATRRSRRAAAAALVALCAMGGGAWTAAPERAPARTANGFGASEVVEGLRAAERRPNPSLLAKRPRTPRIAWRHSTARGRPHGGTLVDGVRLPAEGRTFFSWDPVLERSPGRSWRRYGTDRLVRTLLRVLKRYAAAHPRAPRVAVGDLSRPHGGDFGPEYGLPGHVSHQNGLDVDVYYPRIDRREQPPRSPAQVDWRLAQDLVDRFVRAGAQFVFVGPNVGLGGPRGVVQPLRYHDDHLHLRLPLRPRAVLELRL